MPFIRYSRDKRGYECTFVMHAYRPASGPQQTRVLYLFRSPAHLTVGRKPLDDEVVEALEHTHPDLSFDWTALRREPRPEPRPRPDARRRPARREKAPPGGPRAPERQRPPADAAEAAEAAADDRTLLARVVGAREAGRLRGIHGDVLQRIARRARTPEDRDRLTERARRLNPDEWPEEAAVAAGVQSIESQWDALVAELPQRRRGRRGGRRRDASGPDGPAERSGIMAEGDETHGNDTATDSEGGAGPDGRGGGGHGGPAGAAGAAAGSDVPDDG